MSFIEATAKVFVMNLQPLLDILVDGMFLLDDIFYWCHYFVGRK